MNFRFLTGSISAVRIRFSFRVEEWPVNHAFRDGRSSSEGSSHSSRGSRTTATAVAAAVSLDYN